MLTKNKAKSHWNNWSKMPFLQPKMDFLSTNSEFTVQNEGTYVLRLYQMALVSDVGTVATVILTVLIYISLNNNNQYEA